MFVREHFLMGLYMGGGGGGEIRGGGGWLIYGRQLMYYTVNENKYNTTSWLTYYNTVT